MAAETRMSMGGTTPGDIRLGLENVDRMYMGPSLCWGTFPADELPGNDPLAPYTDRWDFASVLTGNTQARYISGQAGDGDDIHYIDPEWAFDEIAIANDGLEGYIQFVGDASGSISRTAFLAECNNLYMKMGSMTDWVTLDPQTMDPVSSTGKRLNFLNADLVDRLDNNDTDNFIVRYD